MGKTLVSRYDLVLISERRAPPADAAAQGLEAEVLLQCKRADGADTRSCWTGKFAAAEARLLEGTCGLRGAEQGAHTKPCLLANTAASARLDTLSFL